uniref:Uncharacterized protein n=1 Tax=Sphaerodactylus townsendi TaxID=933632 RepID=A0ACB8FKU5_9SAUR
MRLCERGVQMLLTTLGAFAAFSLMTIAVGTDYWLYSRGVCRTKAMSDNDTGRKNEEVLTHSGLWRTCCLEGAARLKPSVSRTLPPFPHTHRPAPLPRRRPPGHLLCPPSSEEEGSQAAGADREGAEQLRPGQEGSGAPSPPPAQGLR